jgi:outer membrane protein assembly factor BamB
MSRVVPFVVALAACSSAPPHVPLAGDAPWPKFRADARQTGRSAIAPTATTGVAWTVPTGGGVFSSPVVAADGTIYVGSADRSFYAIARDGTVAWSHPTGEIIDSAALLDDRGAVYVGSGDGHVYALDAATGAMRWSFAADAPTDRAIINWFEGNVAMGADGTLYAGDDNFHFYAIDREGNQRWRADMPDQTWSSPAVDAATGKLFVGNNSMLSVLGANAWAFDAAGKTVWKQSTSNGSIAASPLLSRDGLVVVGGFDGYVHAIDAKSAHEVWSFAARDHVYASAAELPDGTIVVPAADGTIYAFDPATGALRWSYDTLSPIRSSPAIDGDGNVYVGTGDGRLLVVNHDGTPRWSIRLIAAARSNLNASPALGHDAIYIAGESGEVFSVPYDYCLRDAGLADPRCARDGEGLPADLLALWPTTPFGTPVATPPATIDANAPLVLSLMARTGGANQLALIDSSSVTVAVSPAAAVTTTVSADRRFLVIAPTPRFVGDQSGAISIRVTANTLVDPMRDGLAMTGGTPGNAIDQTFRFALSPAPAQPYAIVPATTPNATATTYEMRRLAAPLPTLLPSYNQIGFDQLRYLVSIVDGGAGHYVAWVIGATVDGAGNAIVDPTTHGVFALDVDYTGGAITFVANGGFSLVAMGATITFQAFRLAASIAGDGSVASSASLVVSSRCTDIQLYGPFLAMLGLCNPDTGMLLVSGAADLRPYAGALPAIGGVGAVSFNADANGFTATVGGALSASAHVVGVLVVDATTGAPLSLDYGTATTVTTRGDGTVANVSVARKPNAPSSVRVYLMVDTTPVASATLAL